MNCFHTITTLCHFTLSVKSLSKYGNLIFIHRVMRALTDGYYFFTNLCHVFKFLYKHNLFIFIYFLLELYNLSFNMCFVLHNHYDTIQIFLIQGHAHGQLEKFHMKILYFVGKRMASAFMIFFNQILYNKSGY